jgi:hypothetical protein
MIYSRLLSSAMAVMAIAISNCGALADTNNASPAPAAKATAKQSSASPKSSSLPKRAIGVIVGIFVGIPVCAVRQPIHEEKYGIFSLAGAKAPPKKSVPYALLYAPFAVVSGLIEAPFYAFNNSCVNYDRPFSKEQFSITDREEPLTVDPIKGTSER